ncbi:MAG: tripartite tricarboxylate transporter substrate binding protein [Betaproteobacteria bacterium]|jgi:tripartite-type tricarboxylate transporter receptor subunit TctC|nr:tripartite tricarboxylate transporter substrate binding protein [Betaproteobacteria bacterium]MDH5342103.1 tripartite tricarboxylate transporter substrate binding protein [Betaproteobacteria bacterium]
MQIARFLVAGIFTVLIALSVAQAQPYPTKTIRIILPFAGGSDTVGRLIATQLSASLGQQVVPDPRVGASGNIGFLAGARSPADGYTLMMGAVPVLTNPLLNPKVGFDGIRDFSPVALLATIPNVVIVHPSVPAKNMRELIRLARSSPGKVAYGSGGFGSANHLAAELIQSATKVKFTHVPYKSATFGIAGALSGEVDMVIVVISSAVSYVQSGKMRALTILDDKRNASIPDVQTSAEAGIPGLIAVNWYAILVPTGTPRPIIDRLNADSVKGMSTPDMRERFTKLGGAVHTGTPEQTAEFLRAEYTRWSKVIREANIKTE